jgi:CRISPR-associated endonuclease/helicase Cas3
LLGRDGAAALREPQFYAEYFERVFANADLDAKSIQSSRRELDYPETADNFRFIEPTVSALVPYADSERRLRRWQAQPSREAWRRMQPYIVNLYRWQVKEFEKDGLLEGVDKGLYRWLGRYDEIRGIVPDALDPSDLIV